VLFRRLSSTEFSSFPFYTETEETPFPFPAESSRQLLTNRWKKRQVSPWRIMKIADFSTFILYKATKLVKIGNFFAKALEFFTNFW